MNNRWVCVREPFPKRKSKVQRDYAATSPSMLPPHPHSEFQECYLPASSYPISWKNAVNPAGVLDSITAKWIENTLSIVQEEKLHLLAGQKFKCIPSHLIFNTSYTRFIRKFWSLSITNIIGIITSYPLYHPLFGCLSSLSNY